LASRASNTWAAVALVSRSRVVTSRATQALKAAIANPAGELGDGVVVVVRTTVVTGAVGEVVDATTVVVGTALVVLPVTLLLVLVTVDVLVVETLVEVESLQAAPRLAPARVNARPNPIRRRAPPATRMPVEPSLAASALDASGSRGLGVVRDMVPPWCGERGGAVTQEPEPTLVDGVRARSAYPEFDA
jgi:hypothetical protein